MVNYLFYSAGFIYNPTTNQVLLPSPDASTTEPKIVDLFGGANKSNEKPEETFMRHFEKATGIKLKKKAAEALYDYFNPDTSSQRHVYWVNLDDIKSHKFFKNENLNWVNLKELHKAKIAPRTKQDLVFFQREMSAKLNNEELEELSEGQ